MPDQPRPPHPQPGPPPEEGGPDRTAAPSQGVPDRAPASADQAAIDQEDPSDGNISAIFAEFADRAGMAAPAADLSGVRARVRRRRAPAWAVAAVAASVLVAPVGVYALIGSTPLPVRETGVLHAAAGTPTPTPRVSQPALVSGPHSTQPKATGAPRRSVPTPSAQPPNQPPAATVDWPNVILAIPANQTGCAAGTATFLQGIASVGATDYQLGSGDTGSIMVAYGDVNSDGRLEALLVVSCVTPAGRVNPPAIVLLVATAPAVRTMALAFSSSPRMVDGEGKSHVSGLAIHADGSMSYDVRTFEGNGQCQYRQRWTGTGLTGSCEP